MAVKLFKRLLRVSLGLSVILIVCVVVLRIVGKVTDEKPISDVQMAPLVEVADADNAYLLVSFIDQDGFSFGEDAEVVASLLQDWDSIKAASILERQQDYLSLAESVTQKEAFKSNALSSIDLPNYSAMGFLSKLPLIKAKLLAESGDYQDAVKYLLVSLKFNNLLTRDANTTLVSYLVGQAYQFSALNQIAEFVQLKGVSNDVLIALQKELDNLNDYSNDGFDLVWSGERIYSKLLLDDILSYSFVERVGANNLSLSYAGIREIDWFSFALALIPEYTMQYGKLNNRSLERWKRVQEQHKVLCADMVAEKDQDIEVEKASWLQLLKPNAIAETVYFGAQNQQFERYFHRRCLSNFHLSAISVLVAIKRYENLTAGRLTSLKQLVPDYLDHLPVDPFSGRAIKLDIANRYLYSYGANFSDDGGSLNSVYSSICHREKECINNPTVSLDVSYSISSQ